MSTMSNLSVILTEVLRIGAAFTTLDGFANFVYWLFREHEGNKRLFQLGRLIRGTLGLIYTILFSLGWKPL